MLSFVISVWIQQNYKYTRDRRRRSTYCVTITLLLFSVWIVFDVSILQPIAAIILSVISWLYLVPHRLVTTLASWSKSADANSLGRLIRTSSTMPSCTSKRKFRRCVLPSCAVTSNARVTVNFGVLPKFQLQERKSLISLSKPANWIYWNIFKSVTSSSCFMVDNRTRREKFKIVSTHNRISFLSSTIRLLDEKIIYISF